jgi:Protein of unknown function (DUF2934)
MKTKSAKPIGDELHRQIAVRAYLIWESEGCPLGRHEEHWRRAEAEIQGAAKAKTSSRANGKAAKVPAASVAAKAKRAAKPKHKPA